VKQFHFFCCPSVSVLIVRRKEKKRKEKKRKEKKRKEKKK
jgi:hypothetical protein